jgi:GTPase
MSDEIVYLWNGEKCRVLRRDGERVYVIQLVEEGRILALPHDHIFTKPPTTVTEPCVCVCLA